LPRRRRAQDGEVAQQLEDLPREVHEVGALRRDVRNVTEHGRTVAGENGGDELAHHFAVGQASARATSSPRSSLPPNATTWSRSVSASPPSSRRPSRATSATAASFGAQALGSEDLPHALGRRGAAG